MIYLPLEKPNRGSDHPFIEDYEIAEEPSNEEKQQATRILVDWLVEHWIKNQKINKTLQICRTEVYSKNPQDLEKEPRKSKGSINT
jgi:hypothetical protein